MDLKLRETTRVLEQQLAEERAANLKAQKKANDEMCRLTENIVRAEGELRNRANHIPNCAIL
jgi:hypothetical protein